MDKMNKSTAAAYQEEMKKDMIFKNRTQTPKTNSSTDNMDMGNGRKPQGKMIASEEDKGQPTREVSGTVNKGGNKGFTSSVSGKTPAK